MRILVTGGLGFIGSHLSERLVADGHTVFVLDNCTTNVVNDITGATVIRADVLTGKLPKVDLVYHLAAPVGPIGVIDWKGHLAKEVIDNAYRLGVHCLSGIRLVDVSTSEVYGSGSEDGEDDVCTFRPEVTARKEYAVAKLAAETMLRNMRIDVRVVRPFNVAGPRQSELGGFVLPRFIRQALRDEPLTVYQPGTQRRAFTHVLDIVEGLLAVAEHGTPGAVYNLGNSANLCSINELAREVIDEVKSDSSITVVDPHDLHGPDFSEAPDKIPNPLKAQTELGWLPSRSREQTIRDAVAASVLARA